MEYNSNIFERMRSHIPVENTCKRYGWQRTAIQNTPNQQYENKPITKWAKPVTQVSRWRSSTREDAPRQVLGETQTKTRYTTHLSGRQKPEPRTPLDAGTDVERQELALLAGMQSGVGTLRGRVVVSQNTEPSLPMRFSHCALWRSPKGAENLRPHKNLRANVYRDFVHNFWNLETTKMFFRGWTGKVVHPDREILFSPKVKWPTQSWRSWKKLKCM